MSQCPTALPGKTLNPLRKSLAPGGAPLHTPRRTLSSPHTVLAAAPPGPRTREDPLASARSRSPERGGEAAPLPPRIASISIHPIAHGHGHTNGEYFETDSARKAPNTVERAQ